jgi:Zinc carboxypeptidase
MYVFLDVIMLRNYFNWYFIPILNVDGYAYTWNSDRTWRKTRGPTSNILCRGTDANRNWDVNFAQYGSSSVPCTSSYHGDFAFSEPETRQLSEFVRRIPNLLAYFSFHSSGNLLMTPYAYSNTTMANHATLLEIGELGINMLRSVHQTNYRLGTIRDFFGYVAGSSVDWMAIRLFPALVYCYELTLTQLNPPSDIIKTGQEIFLSTMSMLQEGIRRNLFV